MFKYDSPVITGLRKLLNLLLISAMWLLLCIPVVTAGASTSAYYHTIDKYMKYDLGYAAPEFFKSFRQNFRTATVCWLVILGGLLLFLGDLAAVTALGEKHPGFAQLDILFYVLIAVLLVYGMWVCACVARFENTVKATLKNALIFTFAYLPTSFCILLLLLFATFVVWLIPAAILLMPGVAVWFSSWLMDKVFEKYLEESTDTERKESTNTGIKENADAETKESKDEGIKENADAGIKESSDEVRKL